MTPLEIGNDAWVCWADPGTLAGQESNALALLSAEERSRLDATIPTVARARLLWGRMLLRDLVGRVAGLDASAVDLEAQCVDCGGPHGRPAVVGGNARARTLTLSVSACAGMVVVGAAAGRQIGVDVEPRAGTDGRLDAVWQLTGHSEDPLRHWTRVEAVLKADGRGLRVDPSRVSFGQDTASLDGRSYRLVDVPFEPAFVLSAALGVPSPKMHPEHPKTNPEPETHPQKQGAPR